MTWTPAPVRVAHVVHWLWHGGAERRLLSLLGSLDRARYEPLIVCIDDLGELSVEARDLGFEPVLLGRSSRRDLGIVARLARLFAREHISIAHGWLPLPSVIARAAAVIARVPVKIYAESQTLPTPDPARARRNALLERVLAPVTDAYLVNSQAVAAKMRDELRANPEKIAVIPNGVAVPEPIGRKRRDALRAELGAGGDDVLIGMTARLDPRYKDHRTFLRAATILAAEGRPVRVALVGDGSDRSALEALVSELSMGGRVTFAGFRRDAAQLCQAFDVSALLSHHEGFSGAILESMAARTPLVASAIPPNREAVENEVHGLLVAPDDERAAASAIGRLLDDPALAERLAAAARERVIGHYSLEAQAEATMRLYDRLLKAPRLVPASGVR